MDNMSVTGKYLLYSLLLLLASFIIGSCASSSKEKESDTDSVGRYVYFDDSSVLHVNEKCYKLRFGQDNHGHSTYAKEVVDTTNLTFFDRVCSICVSTEIYESLYTISKHNRDRDRARKWLYNKFKKANYDLEEYDVFFEILKDPIKRRNAYRNALTEDWEVGTYEDFCKLLGYTIEE